MFRSLFDPDSGFGRAMDLILRLIILNVLWFVCSLPIVTLGASTAALCSVLMKFREGEESHVVRRFFAAWRQNWKRATGTWLILLVLLALFLFDLVFSNWMESFLWKVIAVTGMQVVAMEYTFLYPLLARYENTWRNHMCNALRLGIGYFPRFVLIWLIWAGAIALTLYSPGMLHSMIAVWALLGWSGLHYMNLRILRPVFDKLDNPVASEKE